MKSVCFLIMVGASVVNSADWDYEQNGPKNWPSKYKVMCSGLVQSPIDVDTSSVVALGVIGAKVEITGSESTQLEVMNNGHSVEITPKPGMWTAVLTSEPSTKFTVAQVHFHWGSNDTVGSEHQINGKTYPLEMHIVTYNSDMFATFAEAKGQPNGLAVIGVFFEVQKISDPSIVGLGAYSTFIQSLSKIISADAKESMATFDPKLLLPSDKDDFYRYFGSLTTPHCTQNVQWTIMKNTLPVTSEQLAEFRKLKFSSGKPMQDNYRPVQVLNPPGVLQQRIVFSSFNSAPGLLSLSTIITLLTISLTSLQ